MSIPDQRLETGIWGGSTLGAAEVAAHHQRLDWAGWATNCSNVGSGGLSSTSTTQTYWLYDHWNGGPDRNIKRSYQVSAKAQRPVSGQDHDCNGNNDGSWDGHHHTLWTTDARWQMESNHGGLPSNSEGPSARSWEERITPKISSMDIQNYHERVKLEACFNNSIKKPIIQFIEPSEWTPSIHEMPGEVQKFIKLVLKT